MHTRTCQAAISYVLIRPGVRAAPCPPLVRLLCVGVAGGDGQQRRWAHAARGGATPLPSGAGRCACRLLLLLLLQPLLLPAGPGLQRQHGLAAAAGQVQHTQRAGLAAECTRRHQLRNCCHDLVVVRIHILTAVRLVKSLHAQRLICATDAGGSAGPGRHRGAVLECRAARAAAAGVAAGRSGRVEARSCCAAGRGQCRAAMQRPAGRAGGRRW